MNPALCPCGSSLVYSTCCGRFHTGGEPDDAETLMRSRYAAFVKKDIAYLFRTLHPSHDDHARGYAAFAAAMKRHFAERVAYRKLEVLDRRTPDRDGIAKVLFIARMSHRGRDASFAEISSFAHDGMGWRYLAGLTMPVSALGEEPRQATIAALER